jgi:hypothetical protein
MAANLQSRVLDLGLNVLDTESTHIEVTSQEPANYTEASSTYNLGTKNWGAGAAFGSPAAGSPNGRKVTSTAITDGSITANGTATNAAATDHTNSRLHAVYALSASQVVTSGNTFSMAAFDTRIPSQ